MRFASAPVALLVALAASPAIFADDRPGFLRRGGGEDSDSQKPPVNDDHSGKRRTLLPDVIEPFTVEFNGECNYENLKSKVEKIATFESCPDDVLMDILDVEDVESAESGVRALCAEAYRNASSSDELTFAFSEITKKGERFDDEFFRGGTYLNYEVETDAGEHVLARDTARIARVGQYEARAKIIDLPTYLPSLDPDGGGCNLDAMFCCWVQDRQAGDNNGYCGKPYDTNCIDKDPQGNTDVCYIDHTSNPAANHVDGGFSVFGDDVGGQVHCKGFAWSQDDADASKIYKGNTLFHTSMLYGLHQKGYVKNIPGSSLCGCAENMPVVTRADCFDIVTDETFSFVHDPDLPSGDRLSAKLVKVRDLTFQACYQNDLIAHYQSLVDQEKQTQSNLDAMSKILVGTDTGCSNAIMDFMDEKDIEQVPY